MCGLHFLKVVAGGRGSVAGTAVGGGRGGRGKGCRDGVRGLGMQLGRCIPSSGPVVFMSGKETAAVALPCGVYEGKCQVLLHRPGDPQSTRKLDRVGRWQRVHPGLMVPTLITRIIATMVSTDFLKFLQQHPKQHVYRLPIAFTLLPALHLSSPQRHKLRVREVGSVLIQPGDCVQDAQSSSLVPAVRLHKGCI